MRSDDELKRPSQVGIELVSDHTASVRSSEGFLRLRRYEVRWEAPDGARSAPYRYDVVDRAALDAVAIVLEAELSGERAICLRACIRPAIAFRSDNAIPFAEPRASVVWELPAGVIESDEKGEAGLCACAARETLEEVGIAIDPSDFVRLGPPVYLSPGVVAEKVYFMRARVEVDDRFRSAPRGDGSENEGWSELCFVPLSAGLRAVECGVIEDAKTELALRRLANEGGTP